MKEALARLVVRENLPAELMRACTLKMLEGRASDAEIAALLMGLASKGECAEELAAAAEVSRSLMKPIDLGALRWVCVDPVGTGGDGQNLFNVSTAAAILASACGAKIAKHGNVAASSQSGSADWLRRLGLPFDLPSTHFAPLIERCGFAFIFAQNHHPALRHVGAVRRALGIRTLFNLLGPLLNPARVGRPLIGVCEARWLDPMSAACAAAEVQHALVVHGRDGLDEFGVVRASEYREITPNGIRTQIFEPQKLGMHYRDYEVLKVQSPEESHALITALFAGEGPAMGRDMLAVNAAAILWLADCAPSIEAGVEIARQALAQGKAQQQLENIVRTTQEFAV